MLYYKQASLFWCVFWYYSVTDINECRSNPCLNNGTCNDRINGFNCSCPAGFTGKLCEIGGRKEWWMIELTNNFCGYTVLMWDWLEQSFSCNFLLPILYYKQAYFFWYVFWYYSVIDINECRSNPCLNNGTCNDRINGFNCSCPAGFAGKRCEIGGKKDW